MGLGSTSNFASIFEGGNLKPGVYKIQNLYAQTYLDIHEHSREACCRPAETLRPGKGLWEIKRFGTGYLVRRIDPGKPEQFCTLTNGVGDGSPLCVSTYPAAWRIEIVKDEEYRGYEYVRFFWGITKRAWDLDKGSNTDGRKVQSYMNRWTVPWRIWKLIPVKIESVSKSSKSSFETPSLEPLPPYDGIAWESESDELGTVVTEVHTITTRTRYRV